MFYSNCLLIIILVDCTERAFIVEKMQMLNGKLKRGHNCIKGFMPAHKTVFALFCEYIR